MAGLFVVRSILTSIWMYLVVGFGLVFSFLFLCFEVKFEDLIQYRSGLFYFPK